jgi:chemotaxis family two-component system sensor kinase Cph1
MTEQAVNLDNCVREPIHIPGAILPHGLLFVLCEPHLTILQCSENIADLLDVPAWQPAGILPS